jgi:hypothetical protein
LEGVTEATTRARFASREGVLASEWLFEKLNIESFTGVWIASSLRSSQCRVGLAMTILAFTAMTG